MNRNDFWKQFEGTPLIDCLKMKHDIQAQIYKETKDMTWEERRDYFRKGSEEFRHEMAQRRAIKGDLILCEEPGECAAKKR